MGHIRPGDESLHHHDWSHRWSGGPADDAGQQAYQAALREHMEAHQAGEDKHRPAPRRRNAPGAARQPSAQVKAPTRTAKRR